DKRPCLPGQGTRKQNYFRLYPGAYYRLHGWVWDISFPDYGLAMVSAAKANCTGYSPGSVFCSSSTANSGIRSQPMGYPVLVAGYGDCNKYNIFRVAPNAIPFP